MITVRQLILGVSLFDHFYQGLIPANRCQLRKKHINVTSVLAGIA